MRKSAVPRAVTSIVASNVLLFALNTSPAEATALNPTARAKTSPDRVSAPRTEVAGERVVVRSKGKRLELVVTGQAGRECALSYRTVGMKQGVWKPVPGGRARLGEPGVATLYADMSGLLDRDVTFSLVSFGTNGSTLLAEGARATRPFTVRVSNLATSAIPEVRTATEGAGRAQAFVCAYAVVACGSAFSERVVVKSTGSRLDIAVAGNPGRLCAVTYRTGGMKRDEWRPAPGATAIIGDTGRAALSVDLAPFVDQDVRLVVVTADSRDSFDLTKGARATRSFVVHITPDRAAAERQLQTDERAQTAGATAVVAAAVGVSGTVGRPAN